MSIRSRRTQRGSAQRHSLPLPVGASPRAGTSSRSPSPFNPAPSAAIADPGRASSTSYGPQGLECAPLSATASGLTRHGVDMTRIVSSSPEPPRERIHGIEHRQSRLWQARLVAPRQRLHQRVAGPIVYAPRRSLLDPVTAVDPPMRSNRTLRPFALNAPLFIRRHESVRVAATTRARSPGVKSVLIRVTVVASGRLNGSIVTCAPPLGTLRTVRGARGRRATPTPVRTSVEAAGRIGRARTDPLARPAGRPRRHPRPTNGSFGFLSRLAGCAGARANASSDTGVGGWRRC